MVPVLTNETCCANILDGITTGLSTTTRRRRCPELAWLSPSSPATGTTWTIKIKSGWTFHDGTPVTAQTFVDAWNFAANCNTRP